METTPHQRQCRLSVIIFILFALRANAAYGQGQAPPASSPETAPPAGTPEPTTPAAANAAAGGTKLSVVFVSTRNLYIAIDYEIFAASTREVVASGKSPIVTKGEELTAFDLAPGIYKIVPAGQTFDAKTEFATAVVREGKQTDYVVIVDADTRQFRGSGPVTTELPEGVELAGVRLGLTAGGAAVMNNKRYVVGTTNGDRAQFDLFSNFSMVLDRGDHFLSILADAHLALDDPYTADISPISNRLEAEALYSYKLGNPYFGPYARAAFNTKVFRDYLYLQGNSSSDRIRVTTTDVNGDTSTDYFGDDPNADSLRIKISDPFSPLVFQEEIGGNLQAINLDLILLKVVVATRVGYGFRQGLMNGTRTVSGTDKGNVISLYEVEDYNTHGPVLGATANASFARWLFGNAAMTVMLPLSKNAYLKDAGFGKQLLFDLAATGGVRSPILTSILYASFDYTIRMRQDGFATEEMQLEQTIMAKVNLTLL